jgi:hypothetical protein
MFVKIGPYKRWWGVYQTVDLLQKVGVSEDTCEKISDWICEHTPAEDFFNWIEKLKGDRKVKIRIDSYDTWNMDHTLALIILPMLKQLKATKQGSPLVDNEDVPEHMRHTFSKGPDDYETDDRWVHYKWDWILSEIVWTFQELVNNDWEEKYIIEEGEMDFDDYPEDKGKDTIPLRWKKEYVIDYEGRKNHQDRITNGLRLFGKYYQSFWS